MAETTIISESDPTIHAMDLAVTLAGSTITVGSGSVKFDGVDWTLQADEVFNVVNRVEATEIMAYLVVDTTPDPDELRVYVDEFIQDGVDVAHKFVRGGQYTLLAYLYRVTIPGSTTDVSGLNFDRWRIIAPT